MPFEAVVTALKDAVGRLDLVEFAKASRQAGTFAELKPLVDRNLGKTGLMLFMERQHGRYRRCSRSGFQNREPSTRSFCSI